MQNSLTHVESAPIRRRTVALEAEMATFAAKQAELMQHEGQYVLIAGDEVLGIYESHTDALTAGYEKMKLEPFLVKRISSIEIVSNYTRDIRASVCTASTQ